jgi:hypothetical protein
MPKLPERPEPVTAPALIADLASHIQRGNFLVSEQLLASAFRDFSVVEKTNSKNITLEIGEDVPKILSSARKKYRLLTSTLDFGVPSFEISWNDLPHDFYTRSIEALPFASFMCVTINPLASRVYHFSPLPAGGWRVLGFEKQDKGWLMLPCDMTIHPDLTYSIPQLHDEVEPLWLPSQVAVELLAIINSPTKLISLPPLDAKTRGINDQRRHRNMRLIKQTHKITLRKGIARADAPALPAPEGNGAQKIPHNRREHLRWLSKAQRYIRVRSSKIHGGSNDPAEYTVVVREPRPTDGAKITKTDE